MSLDYGMAWHTPDAREALLNAHASLIQHEVHALVKVSLDGLCGSVQWHIRSLAQLRRHRNKQDKNTSK